MGIGERIKKLRGQLSQEKFGVLVGASKAAVGAYERDIQMPGSAFIISTCARFNVEPKWLLTGAGPMRADETPTDQLPEAGALSEACARCLKLEARLELLDLERKELNRENRALWKEVSQLREENAVLRERQSLMKKDHPLSVSDSSPS